MKLVLLWISVLLAIPGLAQHTLQNQPIDEGNSSVQTRDSVNEAGIRLASVQSLIRPASVDLSDTLGTKRRLFTTDIYKKGEKLSNAAIVQLLQDTRQAQKAFRTGILLKPVAALISVSGLVVGYLGIKGSSETAMIKGLRMPTNSSVPDVQAEYTKRSLPKVLGGLGLFLGGICLLELSQELTVKSVVLYNTKSVSQTSTAQVRILKVGLTSSGRLGLEAHF